MESTPPPSPPDRAAPPLRAMTTYRAYELALAAESMRDRQAMPGYRLYWFGAKLLGAMDVVADPEGYIVIGSHQACEIVLDDAQRVAGRHLLLRVRALDDGFPTLHLTDLRTQKGIVLSNGARHTSMTTAGALVFRLGTHVVVALPSTGRRPETLPIPYVEPRPEPIELAKLPATLVPLDGPEAAPRPRQANEDYEIILETTGQRGITRLSATDLDRGVIVGRYGPGGTGVSPLLPLTISRCHLLLVREQGVVHLHDVASFEGTYSDGVRVRWLPLADDGASVQLSRRLVTFWFRAL